MIEQDRVISAGPQRDEEAYDRAVRPKSLAEYVGQAPMKAQMEIFIQAARQRAEALDHVLIFGPPGLGKTTLAHVIANELGVGFKQTSGPVLERPGDLAALLTNLQPNEVLFVDEIHRLSPVVEEILYPALEDYQLDIVIGEGPGARSIKIDLPPFTLVGVLIGWHDLLERYRDVHVARDEISLVADGHTLHFELQISPLTDWRNHQAGRLVIWRDITSRKRAEQQLEPIRNFNCTPSTAETSQHHHNNITTPSQ